MKKLIEKLIFKFSATSQYALNFTMKQYQWNG